MDICTHRYSLSVVFPNSLHEIYVHKERRKTVLEASKRYKWHIVHPTQLQPIDYETFGSRFELFQLTLQTHPYPYAVLEF